ncbi:MAG TPA: GH3 auxin-responsive promoter family protein [Kofleriaceae bacterium]|nr:GH3 auxin-responsive promoter family protein [Kofleriaceae bacterium]
MSEADRLREDWNARAIAARREVLGALPRARDLQRELLLDACVRPNVDTAFGRAHGLDRVRTIDDYRAAVPIRTYEELRPWIERAAAGEPAVLTAEPPVAFNRTSGTTSAPKLVPVTARFERDYETRRRGIVMGTLVELHPGCNARADATLNFFWDPRRPAASVASGAPALSTAARQAGGAALGMPGSLAPWAAVPAELTADADRFYYRVRRALEHDLRCIIALNPSTLIAIEHLLRDELAALLDDVRRGTLRGRPLGPGNPARAGELAAIAEREGRLWPSDVWPGLEVLATWASAACALYLPRVRQVFGDVAIQPAPIVASEGPITVSIDAHPLGGVAAVTLTFLEFRDPDAPIDAPIDAPTLLCHELAIGAEYEVVMTVPSGLYRYAIGDIVRVVDQALGVPRLEFVRRKGVFGSFTGEKLTEPQIIDAATAALRGLGLEVRPFACVPTWGSPPHYVFVVEGAREVPADRLAAAIDRELAACNEEYAAKRSSHRLAPAQVVWTAAGMLGRHASAGAGAGAGNAATAKTACLHVRPDALAALLREGGSG